MEIWKDIAGYEGLYQVSDRGNVRSLNYRRTGLVKNLVPKRNNCGYLWVELWKSGVSKTFLVHRLVASAFISNEADLPQVNHKNEEHERNEASNLEWCTREANIQYSVKRHPGRGRPIFRTEVVEQVSKDGTLLAVWDGVSKIKNTLGFNAWSVLQCCKGIRKSAYGFIWRFAS